MTKESKIAVLGIVGIPSRYGGFETLAENLVYYHVRTKQNSSLTVWCSGKGISDYPERFQSAKLRYVSLQANGVQSIFFDAVCLWQAIRSGHDRILLLGVSGALALPLIRIFSRRVRIVTNIDGIEWKREKWNKIARMVLRLSEWAAVQFSHEIIADNQAIADYVHNTYGALCHVITYGGDHALEHTENADKPAELPKQYALALCRIEPENNVHLILDAFDRVGRPLVFVGNWNKSAYGRDLKARYADHPNLYLLDPVYEPDELYALRARASVYVHGHSAGGTNPSLVEMMHFGVPILAHGCAFNRHTTENQALYFETSEKLAMLARDLDIEKSSLIGAAMLKIAQRRYTWDQIGKSYFTLLDENF